MITPKDILLSTLHHEKTEQIAWVPFAGVHAGKLTGYNAQEILNDGDKLFEALMEVNKLYRPCGQPVVFDLQLEAEILGCDLAGSYTHLFRTDDVTVFSTTKRGCTACNV